MGKLRLLKIPFLIWMTCLVLAPLLYVITLSLARRGTYGGVVWDFGLEGYWRSFDPIYLQIVLRSLQLGAVTTLVCLTLGVALAWHLATVPDSSRVRLFAILCVPFFINLIARVYALRSLFGQEGPVASCILWLGWTDVDLFSLSQNPALVTYGMIVTYLPFMLFPIFVAMDSFDYSQVEAVYDLGGGPWVALRQVILPQIMPALATGCMMVLVPAAGEYVIPDLLGGAKVMLLGNLITDQFLKSRDWPFGAVLAIELMVVLFFLLVLTFQRKRNHG